jgi:hypothetical protein
MPPTNRLDLLRARFRPSIVEGMVGWGELPSLLQVGAGHDEYKLVFIAALCLAPILALTVDRVEPALVAPVTAVLLSVALVVSLAPNLGTEIYQQRRFSVPWVDEAGFCLRLAAAEPASRWVETIRTSTPPNTGVVAGRSEMFLPAVTQRALWAPPTHAQALPGYWLDNRWNLAEERGYSTQVLDVRETVMRCAYACSDPDKLRETGSQLLSLRRPVALVFFPRRGAGISGMARAGR